MLSDGEDRNKVQAVRRLIEGLGTTAMGKNGCPVADTYTIFTEKTSIL